MSDSYHLAVVVLPSTHMERVPRALDAWSFDAPSLVALVVPVASAGVMVVRLFDEQGQPQNGDLVSCAARL